MLIACDAFKIGDGIRIIGRRIALCYITLRYIENRRSGGVLLIWSLGK